MHRCACSVRALEIFVKDFAGLSIRRPQHHVVPSQRQAFSTRFPSRQLVTDPILSNPANDTIPLPLTGSQNVGHEQSSLRSLDEAWHSDADTLGPSRGGADKHEEFAAVEDVALQAEGPAMVRVAKKMKGLEKKRKRQAQGTWAPLKKEREERRRGKVQRTSEVDKAIEKNGRFERREGRGVKKPVERTERLERGKGRGAGMMEARAHAGRKGSQRKERTEMIDVVSRTGREITRGTVKAGNGASKSTEAREWVTPMKKSTVIPNTRRERMRVGVRTREDGSKASRTTQRDTRAKVKVEPKTWTSKPNPRITSPERTSRATSVSRPKDREVWQVQKASLERKFGEQGWQPSKRLSPDTIEGIRALHVSDPKNYKTETLAKHFQITPEAIRRILKSKWRPNEDEAEDRRQRWEKRGVKKWKEMAELGVRPPAKWRALGVTSKQQQEKRGKGNQRRERDEVLFGGSDDVPASHSFAGRIL